VSESQKACQNASELLSRFEAEKARLAATPVRSVDHLSCSNPSTATGDFTLLDYAASAMGGEQHVDSLRVRVSRLCECVRERGEAVTGAASELRERITTEIVEQERVRHLQAAKLDPMEASVARVAASVEALSSTVISDCDLSLERAERACPSQHLAAINLLESTLQRYKKQPDAEDGGGGGGGGGGGSATSVSAGGPTTEGKSSGPPTLDGCARSMVDLVLNVSVSKFDTCRSVWRCVRQVSKLESDARVLRDKVVLEYNDVLKALT
jgi:hypothetical protein